MRFKDPALQTLVDGRDWWGIARYYVPIPEITYGHVAIALWLCLLLWALVWTWRRLHRPKIPWKLGGATVDLKGGDDSIHSVLGGSSGNGKSTALLSLLKGTDMPICAGGFDSSKPLTQWWEAHEGDERYVLWRMEGDLGWNIIDGPPASAAEGLTAGFERSGGDTGYFRGLAYNRLADLIEEDDRLGRSRDLWRYVDMLRLRTNDSESDRACRRWAGSFETLLKTCGPSLGNDFSLASAMRERQRVLILPNRFLRAESAALIGGIYLVQLRRAMAEVGGFLAFIEEGGQARNYESEIDAIFQAGRTRGCPSVLVTQNMSKLREQVTNNVKVWVVFGQETKREAEAAAEHTFLTPDDFLGLRVGQCWVRSPGKPAKRVKLPLIKPPKRRNRAVQASIPVSSPSQVPQLALPEPKVIESIPEWAKGELQQRVWVKLKYSDEPGLLWTPERGFWRDGPCLLWTSPSNRGGRPAWKDPVDKRTKTVYIETFKWAGGVIPDSYECDHLCGQPLCCEPAHIEAVTTEENIRRRDGRKKALADLDEGRLAA